MKDIGFDNGDSKPCTVASLDGTGWDAPGASMFKKDMHHVYIFDPDGNLPDTCGASMMAIRSGQHLFMFTIEAEEAFEVENGSLSLCRIISGGPAAMKFFGRMKTVEAMSGDIRGILRGIPGCEVLISGSGTDA